MSEKPVCAKGDFLQAKKWVWKASRLNEGGYWLCFEHFSAALRTGAIKKAGPNYVEVLNVSPSD